ncbi:ABC transporter permease [Salipiger bermudensis]|uniref:Polyamine ABC transporter (Permease) n=1 Tax=Salipiger bermudensis (strain DSM 26914 / JCM 13377 / KCTC 12554 / HTCC2601) TaxID=314265 RepID=Q0FUU5_SALBH|nr:ABC transporter permease [Salipiger bermudensis]EAU47986.1 polyamine ABC transporter (permease) [Salipiger bermudensis HTCC2601]MAE90254.1 ABC transporter permease [Pelagibaca sp.]MCA1287188.1 ABC transporter permease [Salipiger bermudensis]
MLKLVNTLIILFLMAPLVAVIGSSITTSNFPTFPPEGATLKWYAKVLNEPAFTDAMLRSLALGLASASIAGLLGTLAAVGLTRLRGRTQQSLTTVILSPILLPTVVLGLALLIFYNRIGLQGTFAGLVAAHVLLTTPFVVRLAMASLSDFDISMEEAARNLGAGPVRAFVQITLPQILPGVIAGVIFAFILSFDELVVTLFLAGPEMQTLPIRIYTFLEYQSEPTISAVASIIILIWMALGLPLYARLTGAKKGPSA